MIDNDKAQLAALRDEGAKIAWGNEQVIKVLQAENAEYKRLLAALARLQELENCTYIAPLENSFAVSIRDVDYDAMNVASAFGVTLLEACEKALAAYDALAENER